MSMLLKRGGVGARSSSRRFVSSPSLSWSDGYTHKPTQSETNSASPLSQNQTVNQFISQLPSKTFIKSLGETYFNSFVVKDKSQVKLELCRLASLGYYDSLLKVLLTLTQDVDNLQKVLLKDDLTYFINFLITHQNKCSSKLVMFKSTGRNNYSVEKLASEVSHFKNGIRTIYSQLLYGPNSTFIYDREVRKNLSNSSTLTGYKLTVNDYESLINFEYKNLKLDLATKWIERFIQDYGESNMTEEMWKLKFQIHCKGDPKLWTKYNNAIYTAEFKHLRSVYTPKPFVQVYNEFKQHKSSITDDLFGVMIYCLGYNKNTKQIQALIEERYGIDTKGEKVKTITEELPTNNTLESIVVSLLNCGQFYSAMTYLNAFQDHFNLDLSNRNAKSLWDNLFRWSDLTTRYDKDLSLKFFIDHYNRNVKLQELEELKQNADFNYEKYLQFCNNLLERRINIMTELWQLYHQSYNYFSTFSYRMYGMFLSELQQELKYYEYFELLLNHYHAFQVSSKSFNKIHTNLNETGDSIYNLYQQLMKRLIKLKLHNTLVNQVMPLIEEWSIDNRMKVDLTRWFQEEQLHIYHEETESKRRIEMIKQRSDDNDDDDDSILHLL